MILALALAAPVVVKVVADETLVFDESFRMTEVRDNVELRASGTRKQTWKVTEMAKGTATITATYSDPETKADAGGNPALEVAARLKAGLFRDALTFKMNDRGIVNAPIFPEGSRPFFGLALPGKRDPLPETWGEKLVAPFGPDRVVDFKFRLVATEISERGRVYHVSMRSAWNDKTSKFNLSGDVFLSEEGRLVRSEVDARWEEQGIVTAIAYRAVPVL